MTMNYIQTPTDPTMSDAPWDDPDPWVSWTAKHKHITYTESLTMLLLPDQRRNQKNRKMCSAPINLQFLVHKTHGPSHGA